MLEDIIQVSSIEIWTSNQTPWGMLFDHFSPLGLFRVLSLHVVITFSVTNPATHCSFQWVLRTIRGPWDSEICVVKTIFIVILGAYLYFHSYSLMSIQASFLVTTRHSIVNPWLMECVYVCLFNFLILCFVFVLLLFLKFQFSFLIQSILIDMLPYKENLFGLFNNF